MDISDAVSEENLEYNPNKDFISLNCWQKARDVKLFLLNLLFFFVFENFVFNALKNKKSPFGDFLFMRRVRDSNPGRTCILNGFQDRRIQPLCQLSVDLKLIS